MIRLRPYQVAALDGLRDGFRTGHKNQLLSSGTGSGKTEMAMSLFESAIALGSRCLFLVDRVVLLRQASERFYAAGIEHGVIGGGITRSSGNRVIIGMQQTLELQSAWPAADMVVVDEAHTQRRKTTAFIRSTDAAVIGLSATPFSEGMGKTYSRVVNAATTYDLVEQGYLVMPDVYTATPIDMSGAKTAGGEWADTTCAERAAAITGDIVSEWASYTTRIFGGPVKTLVFSPTIAYGAELARQFNEAGYRFEQVAARSGPKPTDLYAPDLEEAEKIRRFRDGEITGLISVDKLAKGFDVPDVLCIVSARPYRKSVAGHIQQIGRVMRSAPGKTKALLLDHAGNFTRHWDATDHFWRHGIDALDDGALRKYSTAPPTDANAEMKCIGCGYILLPVMKICPMCGRDRPKRKSRIEAAPGRMERFRRLADEVGDLWPHVSAYALERHPTDQVRALRFAKANYHELTGRWPDSGLAPAERCDPRVAHQIELSFDRWKRRQRKARRTAQAEQAANAT